MKKMRYIVMISVAAALSGCMTATYTRPEHNNIKEKYSTTLNKGYDDVWQSLIKYSASTFFSIDNYEKDSGLITLTFGSSNPSRFITGGDWKTTGTIKFDGDYVEYLEKYQGATLNGKMNIVVTKSTANATDVMVNARYIFTTPSNQNSPSITWVFDTGTCSTKAVSNPAMGTSPERTVCPTYSAENAIINALTTNP